MLEQHIEAIIFSSEQPIPIKEIKDALNLTFGWTLNEADIEEALQKLFRKYEDEQFSFELRECGGGFQFMTKKEYAPLITTYLNQKSKKRLSRAALEALSIIAYKQPVTKTEVESIRGVNCDYTIQKLLEKDLIAITGRAESPGKPLLYVTSEYFMDYFGINSPADLPKVKEIEASQDNQIGIPEFETTETEESA